MEYFRKYTILSVEKKVGGLVGVVCCPPNLMVGYSGVVGDLNVENSP